MFERGIRQKIFTFFFVIVASLIIVFLIRWQIVDYGYFSGLASQRLQVNEIIGTRGKIMSSDGATLVYSLPSFDIYVYLVEMQQAEVAGRQTFLEVAQKISPILNIDELKLLDQLKNSKSNYFSIANKVDIETERKILNLKQNINPNRFLEGIIINDSTKRIYPGVSFACHILGFIGKNDNGEDKPINGIEAYWNGDLSAKISYEKSEKDRKGDAILTSDFLTSEVQDGRNIILTINRGLQSILEKKLKEGFIKYNPVSADGIIMDPKTGDILAMASYPNFDPNEYYKANNFKILNNNIIANPYEPGSVGKAFTVAAAIDLGVVDEKTVLTNGHNGCIKIYEDEKDKLGWNICTAGKSVWKKPLDVITTLENSDNIGSTLIAEKVGIEKMDDYLRKFGIGQKTKIDLAAEGTSYLKTASTWKKIDLATYSFGQGYSATAIQLISGYSAIANNGKRVKPRIVKEVDDENEKIEIPIKLEQQVISEESASKTTKILTSVFERMSSGSKYKSILKNYSIAGKSGTAQIAKTDGIGYNENDVNATYIGYDASPEKKFVMLIKLEKPADGGYSGTNVFPLWLDTFIEIKDLLGINLKSN